MKDESRVWIRRRTLRSGKAVYDLRYVCPAEQRWKSRKVGTDYRRALAEQALLQERLRNGTYKAVKRTAWESFVDDHVSKIPGKANRAEAVCTLREFGKACSVTEPRKVKFADVERYVVFLRDKGLRPATVNKKLRYLRTAFLRAVKREYMAATPMDGWSWEPENVPQPRVVTTDEEKALLDATDRLYGFQWRMFVHIALQTGARRGELLALTWDRVDFGDRSVCFTHTKGRRDRTVPLTDEVVAMLRRLQAATLRDGGPFRKLRWHMWEQWSEIRREAGIDDVTLHDLRRTCTTRLLQAGTDIKTVQELLGHADATTTLRYYAGVTDSAKREAVAKLNRVSGA